MLNQIIKLTQQAGELAEKLKINLQKKVKIDGSTVTNADVEVESLLIEGIRNCFGAQTQVLSEELVDSSLQTTIDTTKGYWLLDPIDATASYANGKPDYCINIAYIENNTIEIGVIASPTENAIWYAVKGKGAFKLKDNVLQQIFVRQIPANPVAVTSKKGHQLTAETRRKLNIQEEVVISSALKFCYLAEGKADYYFRQRNYAKSWDVASGILIVEEAGGTVEFIDEDRASYDFSLAPYLAPSMLISGKK